MKSSIHWKIIAIYLSVVLIIMITSGSFIILNIEESYYNEIVKELEYSANQIEGRLLIEETLDLEADSDTTASVLRSIISLNRHVIHILDNEGKVLINTSSGSFAPGEKVSEEVVQKALRYKTTYTKERIPFGSMHDTQAVIDHAKPILDETTGDIVSVIYVVAEAKELYENTMNVLKTISVGSVFAMGIAVVFSSMFSRMITVPIKQLTTSAKQLAGGSFNRIPIYSGDEIGQLTQSFNLMATELSRTMGAISSEKSKLEKILENMADGVMAFNRQGVLIHANSVCYEMIGITNMDHRFDYIFPNIDVEASFDEILSGEAKYDEGIMAHLDDRYFNLHFAPYNNGQGESEGLVVVMQDVTNQQKLDNMRKEFVANVSHELRTPLTTVKSYTETLIDGAIDDREIAMQFLSVMEKEADRMTNLVQDLLELSRIDNRQMQLNVTRIDLKELVKDTIEAQKIHAYKKQHTLTWDYQEGKDYEILGDSARVRQILHNIISNAIKYSIDPGNITVKLYRNEDVVIQVQDTGIGIAEKDIERIFERFYRVDKARSRNLGGTGLGLAIAKEMVELHGGRIKMTSKVGKGTTVTIYFQPNYQSVKNDVK